MARDGISEVLVFEAAVVLPGTSLVPMTEFLIFALAFAPGIFWLWFFYRQDRWQPEPKRLVVRTFFWGLAAALPAVLLELPFRETPAAAAVLVAPVVEELAKFFVVFLTVYRNPAFDEPMDGIVYAAAAALGFASIENAFYLLNENANATGDGVATLFVVRALLSVPAHVMFSSMWGYALGWRKFSPTRNSNKLLFHGLWSAAALHAVFNAIAVLHFAASLLMIVLARLVWKNVKTKIDELLGASPFAPGHEAGLPAGAPLAAAAPATGDAQEQEATEFICESCGAPVPADAAECPNCHAVFEEKTNEVSSPALDEFELWMRAADGDEVTLIRRGFDREGVPYEIGEAEDAAGTPGRTPILVPPWAFPLATSVYRSERLASDRYPPAYRTELHGFDLDAADAEGLLSVLPEDASPVPGSPGTPVRRDRIDFARKLRAQIKSGSGLQLTLDEVLALDIVLLSLKEKADARLASMEQNLHEYIESVWEEPEIDTSSVSIPAGYRLWKETSDLAEIEDITERMDAESIRYVVVGDFEKASAKSICVFQDDIARADALFSVPKAGGESGHPPAEPVNSPAAPSGPTAGVSGSPAAGVENVRPPAKSGPQDLALTLFERQDLLGLLRTAVAGDGLPGPGSRGLLPGILAQLENRIILRLSAAELETLESFLNARQSGQIDAVRAKLRNLIVPPAAAPA